MPHALRITTQKHQHLKLRSQAYRMRSIGVILFLLLYTSNHRSLRKNQLSSPQYTHSLTILQTQYLSKRRYLARTAESLTQGQSRVFRLDCLRKGHRRVFHQGTAIRTCRDNHVKELTRDASLLRTLLTTFF